MLVLYYCIVQSTSWWLEILKERDRLEDIEIDERVTLK